MSHELKAGRRKVKESQDVEVMARSNPIAEAYAQKAERELREHNASYPRWRDAWVKEMKKKLGGI